MPTTAGRRRAVLKVLPLRKCPMADNPPCKDPKAAEAHKRRQVAAILHKEIRRFDLRHREQTIADILVDLSFGVGLASVRVPQLSIFEDMTGISRGNVHTALEGLHRMEIVRIEPGPGGPVYSVNPNSAEWRCRTRVAREQVRKAVEIVMTLNGLNEGQPGDPKNFKACGGAYFLPSAVSDLEMEVSKEDGCLPPLD